MARWVYAVVKLERVPVIILSRPAQRLLRAAHPRLRVCPKSAVQLKVIELSAVLHGVFALCPGEVLIHLQAQFCGPPYGRPPVPVLKSEKPGNCRTDRRSSRCCREQRWRVLKGDVVRRRLLIPEEIQPRAAQHAWCECMITENR